VFRRLAGAGALILVSLVAWDITVFLLGDENAFAQWTGCVLYMSREPLRICLMVGAVALAAGGSPRIETGFARFRER
jgi:hypothetical protein